MSKHHFWCFDNRTFCYRVPKVKVNRSFDSINKQHANRFGVLFSSQGRGRTFFSRATKNPPSSLWWCKNRRHRSNFMSTFSGKGHMPVTNKVVHISNKASRKSFDIPSAQIILTANNRICILFHFISV